MPVTLRVSLCQGGSNRLFQSSNFFIESLLGNVYIAIESHEDATLNSVKFVQVDVIESTELHVQALSVDLAEYFISEAIHDGANSKQERNSINFYSSRLLSGTPNIKLEKLAANRE